MKKRSETQKVGTQKPETDLVRKRGVEKRLRELRRELKVLHTPQRGGQLTDADERMRMIREKGQEYSEKCAERRRIYAAECMADLEKKRAGLLKGLEDLDRERAHILAGDLVVYPTPEMEATGSVREGISILEASSERGDKHSHQELEFILRDALWNLLRRATDGDERAFRALLALLGSCIDQLYDLRHRQPEMVRKFAAGHTHWPGFLTVDPDVKRTNTILIGFLRLGDRVMANFKGKTWTRRTPEVRVAFRLVRELVSCAHTPRKLRYKCNQRELIHQELRKLAKALAPLNRSNYAVWWKAAEPLLAMHYGKDYENHKEFVRYWKSDAYQEPSATPGLKVMASNARALIRRDIKRNIKQAFRSIAPKLSAVC